MKVKLYKQFEHWYHGGTIWLFSDPHFNDPDSFEMDPNWPVADDMVKAINYNLSKNDTLIILGDIGNVEYVKKLKGYKVLVMGNHDKGVSNYIKKYIVNCIKGDDEIVYETDNYTDAVDCRIEMMSDLHSIDIPAITDNGLFDEVYEGPIFINDKILLSHEPIDIGFGYNIHGHCHLGSPLKYNEHSIQINIAADVANYAKVRLDDIYKLGKVDDVHRITIDRATERKYGS